MQAPADVGVMPPPRSTRTKRAKRYAGDKRNAPEPKQPGKKRVATGDQAATVTKGGLDAQEAKRQRRLAQNRLAAKKAYDKRVKRQADMEREYESLRQQLQATNAEAATLGAFLSQTALPGRLHSGQETPPLSELARKPTKRSQQPAPIPSVPAVQAPTAAPARPLGEPARAGTQYRRVQSIEALTSLVSMVDESSANSF